MASPGHVSGARWATKHGTSLGLQGFRMAFWVSKGGFGAFLGMLNAKGLESRVEGLRQACSEFWVGLLAVHFPRPQPIAGHLELFGGERIHPTRKP